MIKEELTQAIKDEFDRRRAAKSEAIAKGEGRIYACCGCGSQMVLVTRYPVATIDRCPMCGEQAFKFVRDAGGDSTAAPGSIALKVYTCQTCGKGRRVGRRTTQGFTPFKCHTCGIITEHIYHSTPPEWDIAEVYERYENRQME